MAVGVVSYLSLTVPIRIERPKASEWFVVTSPDALPLMVSGRGSDADAKQAAGEALQTLAQTLVEDLDPGDWTEYLAANRTDFEVRFRGTEDDRLTVEARSE